MSLPVLLPGSCCPVAGAPQLAEQPYRTRPRGPSASSRVPGGGSRLLLPGRPLLSLGLLQLLLGGSMVALCFGARSLSSAAPVRTSCPFWAGSSVILSGIVGLTTWRRPMLLLVNVFVLLSLVCVLLNLAGFILCCQGAQLVSSMTSCQLSEAGDVCYCCAVSPSSNCPQEQLLQLHPAPSCSTMRVLLKVLFALCALNALTTAVCLMAAALRYLQIFSARTQCLDEHRAPDEEGEDPGQGPDPDEFVAPAPPPSYFSTFYSYTPRLARRILGDGVIPLPHIYGSRIKGVEVFCPLDPPPPYEVVAGSSTDAARQETEVVPREWTTNPTAPVPCVPDGSPQMVSASPGTNPQILPLPPPSPPPPPQQQSSPALTPCRKVRIQRSNSDPVLMDLAAKVQSSSVAPSLQTTDSATQTSQPTLASCAQGQVTLRRGGGRTPRRPRPSSMVDYQSYRHTQQLVRKILDQPAAQGLVPEVQELVDSIRNVLQSDQEHMEEAVRCASYIEQVFTDSQMDPSQPAESHSVTFPRPRRTRTRRRPRLLHLQSCGDLSSFTCESVERRGNHPGAAWRGGSGPTSRTGSRLDRPERPHSLIGVFRETVL
ncbi:endosomal transmembrane epsin interactor 1 isoform X1 [Gasterosteus aculeatus]|uniref:protein FAM189A2 isoform X2 n=1 Tax=Gasterosteus aculeatus aculeatus TaxID=481459 RepID=UPI001A984123|nr:protein FAM189A2 isoform X2 [Gasterosteus aculeatus aculeatus]